MNSFDFIQDAVISQAQLKVETVNTIAVDDTSN